MYLSRANRILCLFALAIGIPVLITAFFVRETAAAIAIIVVDLFLLVPGSFYFFYIFSEAGKKAYQRNILRDDLKFEMLMEEKGIQFFVAIFPDQITPPSYTLIAVFLQNCHSKPRNVSFRIQRNPLRTSLDDYYIKLRGGEAGVLIAVAMAEKNLRPGDYQLRFKLRAKAPFGTGKRVIKQDGSRNRVLRTTAFFTVSGAPAGESAANEHFKDKNGFISIFHPESGVTAPLLEKIDFLN
jgi:hypothetical protein